MMKVDGAILLLRYAGPILFQEIEMSKRMTPATLTKGASMVTGEGIRLETDGGGGYYPTASGIATLK